MQRHSVAAAARSDNQPVMREQIVVLHNGIIVNEAAVWKHLGKTQELGIDTEEVR